MKIVVDTNVWISGLLWKGIPAKLLRLAEHGTVQIWASTDMVEELRRVLGYPRIQRQIDKLQLSQSEIMDFALILMHVALVDATISSGTIETDPDDDIFLACAMVTGASYLVSGDHHILDLGTWHGIQIVTVNEFFDRCFPVTNNST